MEYPAKAAPQIAASILSADFSRLGEQVAEALQAGIRRVHVDVMDGHLVPNLSMGPQAVRALRPIADRFDARLDVHLMITEPERYIQEFVRSGADFLSVHAEACAHLYRTVQEVRRLGAHPGVALNPATPLVVLEELLADLDFVLVMTVEPGFGGQDFIPAGLGKIARLSRILNERKLEGVSIAVDGGIHRGTAAQVVQAGATILVAGSALFNSQGTVGQNLRELTQAAGLDGQGSDQAGKRKEK